MFHKLEKKSFDTSNEVYCITKVALIFDMSCDGDHQYHNVKLLPYS